MEKVGIVKLRKTTYVQGSIGQNVSTVVERQVFCSVGSIAASEFFDAGAEGLRPKYMFTIWEYEYQNEDTLTYEGENYIIYRTYVRKDGRIELYTQVEA